MPPDQKRLYRGDHILLSRSAPDLANAEEAEHPPVHAQTSCTIPEILDRLSADAPVYIDDGKIRTRVEDMHYPLPNGETGLLLRITHARPKGEKTET